MAGKSSSLFSFATLMVVIAICLSIICSPVTAQGVSKTGKKDGNALLSAAKKIPNGNYVFQAYNSKKTLTLISTGNLLAPRTSGQNEWAVKQHSGSKYFTIRANNKAGLPKCISTRWSFASSGGFPDAAVMWQCEVDTPNIKYYGYDPIYPPKQMWLAIPDSHHKGYYKIVSASHLFDMTPNCISVNTISGGVKFTKCKIDTNNTKLLWKLTKQ
ncbi:hypothetical protein J3Q64DRAFT_1710145 [Phycomyces blakesleeanus]|uniref:Ricin B lectin domain-containing protein n=2 Tax=Phycomyces blakesleeanus TaxID=4837 RepID=A0A162NAI3_PHYB8|nr:hypothetical protein PHYBLDRAFT_183618 [Phycomyces blakesleeanus NRRL 1555(-)]OAD67344.1 hypothetical protein PHYBLDRAFT_183618 [Phycomyces blakesleeanus NRRL 1555(-)]|eukprot:XP_018285384.1 hypothetical protein PHYBLDRAFT_183618 [Phycomyces blakesleeanus NRRL 1555(-)]